MEQQHEQQQQQPQVEAPTASYFGNTSPDATRDHIVGMGISMVVHLAIAVAIVVGTIAGGDALANDVKEEVAPYTPVELVRLGDPDSTSLEPTNPGLAAEEVKPKPKIEPPKPRDKQPEVKPVETQKPDPNAVSLRRKPEEKKPTPRETRKDSKAKKSSADLLKQFTSDPDAPVNNTVQKGHRDGVPEGTTLNATERNLWVTRVQSAVRRRWRVPSTMDPEEAKACSGKVSYRIRVSPEGYIVSEKAVRQCGNPVFDGSVRRAVMAFKAGGAKLPMPDDPILRAQVTKMGISLNNWRYTGN
ncbi:MAG: TonB C-terminal domain-containing protein [Myxococcota bacterium]